MMRSVFFSFIFVFTAINLQAEPVIKTKHQNLDTCSINYDRVGICPSLICRLDCLAGISMQNCQKVCLPKACFEISADNCPLESCQLVDGCDQKKICFPKNELPETMQCGDLAYFGEKACCEGLAKKCGTEFFDGSCDMQGHHSMYGAPICIPCGDETCGQFENACNCPEDCKKR